MDDQATWATTFRNADRSSHLVRIELETAATESVFDLASIDLTPYLPLPIHWPPSRPEDEVVFVCAVCATDISRPVGPLPGVPPIPENEVGEYERMDDWVPEGRYFIEPGGMAPAGDVRNAAVLNDADVLNTERDPDAWHGCCGADGLDGPNLRCSNGASRGAAEVGLLDLERRLAPARGHRHAAGYSDLLRAARRAPTFPPPTARLSPQQYEVGPDAPQRPVGVRTRSRYPRSGDRTQCR